MKTQERRHLKQNEFAETAARMSGVVAEHGSRIGLGLGIAAVVLAVAGGVYYWRARTADQAGALLGVAMSAASGAIAPPSTLPGAAQPPGTFPTEQARAEAAIKAYAEVVREYPNTEAATIAGYQLASEYLAAGKFGEAEAQFKKMVDKEGTSFYGWMARLGLAQTYLQAGRTDEAIKAYSELAAARDTALPIDGVLMELARANLKAGKSQDARASLKRVVDEFPDSGYAADAKQQLAAIN
jgi:TolA-binding protein